MIRDNRDAIAVLLVNAGSRAASLLGLAALAQLLDQRDVGILVTLTAALGLSLLATDFGTSERLILDSHMSSARDVTQGLRARLTAATIASLAAALAAVACFGLGWTLQGGLLAVVSISLPFLAGITNDVVVDRLANRPVRAAAWATAPATAPILGALAGASVDRSATSALVGMVAGVIAAACLSRSGHRTPITLAGSVATKQILWASRHLAISAVSIALYSRGDRLVLATISGPEPAAEYVAAYTLVFGFAMLGPALAWASLPALSRMEDRSEWAASVRSRLTFTAVGAGAISTAFFLTAPPLVDFFFGSTYVPTRPGLIAFTVLSYLYVLNPMLGAVVMSRAGELALRRVALVSLGIAAFSFPLAASVGEASGLAIASAGIELFNSCVLGVYVYRKVRNIQSLPPQPAHDGWLP